MADLYDRLAPFYDLGMAGFDADVDLYLGFAGRVPGPVLELGCGTGRLALSLARAGLRVTGVDRSEAMLELARAKLAREPRLPLTLAHADMCDFSVAERFALIVIPLDSFLHLQTRLEQLACLRVVKAHLAKGGLLLLDLPGPAVGGWEDWSAGVRPLVLVWSHQTAGGDRVNKYSSFAADASVQTHQVTEIYERAQPDGLVRRWTIDYTLRYVFPAELELLLERAGLRLQACYGDYELGAFDADSPRQFAVAMASRPRRPGQLT